MRIASLVRSSALRLAVLALLATTTAAAAASSYDPYPPRNGAGQPVDQNGIPLPGTSLGAG